MRCSLFTTAVMPEPGVMITSVGAGVDVLLDEACASWYASVIVVPVVLDSECVLATNGPNRSSIARSIGR